MRLAILNPSYELECIVSTNILYDKFKRILSRLNGNFSETHELERLDITFPRDSKYKNIRVTIFGFYNINKYCHSEKLDGIKNITIEEKKPANEKINRLIINEYDLKFNLKQELKINKDLQYIRDLLESKNWREIPKIFRYKKIYQYVMPNEYSIDCSIVRSSQMNNTKLTINEILKRNLVSKVIKPDDVNLSFNKWWNKIKRDKEQKVLVSNVYTFFKSIKESKVFENTITYEIEVEYIGNTNENKKKYSLDLKKDEIISNNLKKKLKYITIILQCIQKSFYLMTLSENNKLVKDYLKMLNSDNKSLFIGALPVDLQHINCIQIPEKLIDKITEPNILTDYAVCEKIDGDRNLMYVGNDGECYFISRDNDNIFRRVGMNLGTKYSNSIYDGEYLEYDLNDKYLNKFIIFDCYIFNNKILIDTIFGNEKTENKRYYYLKLLEKYYFSNQNDIKIENGLNTYAFKLDFVQYLFGDTSNKKKINNQLIFEQTGKKMNKMNIKYGGTLREGHLYSYPTDGLIYMPTNKPLYNFKICDENGNNKALLCNRKVSSYFKWKPLTKLTIDFRINIPLKNNKYRIYHYENGKKYVEVHLKSRNYDSFIYNKTGKQTISSNISSYLINENRNLYKEPEEVLFMAVQPYVGSRNLNTNKLTSTLHIAFLEVDDENNILCDNNDIIYNNDVVEMNYKLLNDENIFKCWNPIRVRPNKIPNALNTAIDIWKLLHYNISKHNIMNGLSIGDMFTLSNKYNLQLEYKPPLQQFMDHCKKYLLDKFLKGLTNPKICDFGCNNMDYYIKYVSYDPSLIVGIDNNIDVLNNKKNSAGSLLLNYSTINNKIRNILNKTMLINGDLSKILSTGESADNNILSEYYLDILYGRYKPDKTENIKLHNMFNQAGTGFNMIVAFNIIEEINNLNEDLNTFIYNVSNNLREQGYFIGIFLDGDNVEQLLKNTDENSILSGDDMTWLIERDNIKSSEINVYYNYYNTIKKNYIINIKYLENKCKEFGLKLIDSKIIDEDFNELKSSYKKDITQIENKESQGWLGLQRYFIFQKSEIS